jgi:hypothetical protein
MPGAAFFNDDFMRISHSCNIHQVVSDQQQEDRMNTAHTAFGNKAPAMGVEATICPYREVQSEYCSASVMRMRINQRRNIHYCLTENFDCCPVFLAKILRGS